MLRLTQAGEQIVRLVTEHSRTELARILSRMTPELRADLITALTHFTQAAWQHLTDQADVLPGG